MAGYTSSSMAKEVARPPTIGATTRFIMSEPAPIDHMMGIKPMKAAETVIIFGRTRLTAPWMIASIRSAFVFRLPFAFCLVVGQIQEQEHEDAGLRVKAHQCDHADPGGNRNVVAEDPHEPDGADQ